MLKLRPVPAAPAARRAPGLGERLRGPLFSRSSMSRVNTQADVIVSAALKDKGLTRTTRRQIIRETEGDTWQRFNRPPLNQVTLPGSRGFRKKTNYGDKALQRRRRLYEELEGGFKKSRTGPTVDAAIVKHRPAELYKRSLRSRGRREEDK